VDIGHGLADRDARVCRSGTIPDHVGGDIDRGLCRSVEVYEPDASAKTVYPPLDMGGRQGLAAENQRAQVREARAWLTGGAQELAEKRWDEVHDIDATIAYPLAEGPRVANCVGRDGTDGPPDHQWPEELPDRDVEAHRGLLRDALTGSQAQQ